MKKISILLILLSISLLAVCQVHDNAGNYGFKFLQNPTNPVALSLAGRGSYSSSNPSAFVKQPASQVLESHKTISVSHTLWFADTNFSNISYSSSDRISHFGLILRNLDYGEIESRDESGLIIGSYRPLDMNLMMNYSRRLSPSQYFGVNGGILYEKLNTASAYGFSGDLGYTYLPPILDSQLSASVRNLGFTSKMNQETIKLPVTAEMELSKGFRYEDSKVTFGILGSKASDQDFRIAANTEFDINGIFFVRGGYKFNYDAEDLSLGFGVMVKGLGINYGWASYTNQLDDVHSFGISYNF